MKIVIAVATAESALRAFLASNRNKVVPPESVAKGYLREKPARFSIQMLAVNSETPSAKLGEWLASLAETADGLILLIDESLRHLVIDFEDAYFVVGLEPYPGRFLQNYVRSIIAPVLKHFAAYSQRFDNFRNRRVFLLPLDIFQASDLNLLRTHLTKTKMQPGLGSNLDKLIAALNRRGSPKTRSRFRHIYLVDDRPLWYRYGPEQHAIIETTVPPHHDKCRHNSRFRFGRLYDDRFHHNVDNDSRPTKVHGKFMTCHGQIFAAKGVSHLNVFPNGYI
jgi:hypothetical protein